MQGAFSECHIPPTFDRYHRLTWMNDGADARLVHPQTSPSVSGSFWPAEAMLAGRLTTCLLSATGLELMFHNYEFFWTCRAQFILFY